MKDPKPNSTPNHPAPDNDKPNMPPAGPHERSELIDEEKPPGTGALPDKESGEIDAGSG